MSENRFRQRAADLFERQAPKIQDDIHLILSNASASGRLGSGYVILGAIEAHERRTSEALKQAMEEVAAAVHHRGRAWTAAMDEVRAALDDFLSGAYDRLAPYMGIRGRLQDGTGRTVAKKALEEAAARHKQEWQDFLGGWTAPAPKAWKDRHPVAYATGFAVIGAALAKIADLIEIPF